MIEEVFLFEEDLLAVFLYAAGEFAAETPLKVGGHRKRPLFAGEPNIVRRQRTEEQEEELRLLKLLNKANDAKSLLRWQEAENEAARRKHNALLFSRLEREAAEKKARNTPDIRKANKEIAKREAAEEAKRQERIKQTRIANLEKARKAKKK